MAKVLLDDKYYEVKDGTIQRRNINPRAARFDTGPSGYASFTEGSVKQYKGLRGGIGHRYDTGEGTEECYWSEGVDATHHSGIVLGPKINTAGTGDGAFGVAPVKIINFEDITHILLGIGYGGSFGDDYYDFVHLVVDPKKSIVEVFGVKI